jgi:REP element-mobilizing transposase RayT
MSEKAELPDRKHLRLKGWNYSCGCYFITCNTHENKPLFGAIVNGRMVLNAAGQIANEEWLKSAELRKEVELDEFVIMPNHVHGIVRLRADDLPVAHTERCRGDRQVVRPSDRQVVRPSDRQVVRPGPRLLPRSLGALIAGYKGAVGKRVNEMCQTPGQVLWHRNYWDVIVRDEKALENIRNYIRFNPMNYHVVMNGGEPKYLGNRALLELPNVGFLASRGEAALHGNFPLKSGEVIMSGFLSPMERALFKAGLANRKPMIWVKPWALEEGIDYPPISTATKEGRLLIISPFADQVDTPSVRRAAWCNQYVLAHSNRMVIGHLNPSGMLACILTEAPPDLEVAYLSGLFLAKL